jgi:choline dehydrogenase
MALSPSTDEFDYIICGGGTSGCVLAQYLSRDPSVKVVVLEAGPVDTGIDGVQTPALFGSALRSHDWDFATEPQEGLGGRRRVRIPQPKVLGGGSSVLPAIYTRGNRFDYDDPESGWAARAGPEWDYAHCLPYYKRAENNRNGASHHHGTGGVMSVADLKHVHELSRVYVTAAVEQGMPKQYDFNGEEQAGTGFFQVLSDSGERQSTATAYVRPAGRRANLGLRVGVQVTRVLFEGNRAVGVAYVRANEKFEARARREVILCAGAINTPKLLLLSGVGPAEELAALGIKVVADVPAVGRGLRDAVSVAVSHNCGSDETLEAEDTFVNRMLFKTVSLGPLTSPVFEAGSHFRSVKDAPAPDMGILFCPGWWINHGQERPSKHGFTLLASLLKPLSTGSVRLRSSDPFDKPVIDPGYLKDPADLERLLMALKTARHVVEAFAFTRVRGEEFVPGSVVEGERALAVYIRDHLSTLYHPRGSCPMGTDPATSAVTPHFAVRGTEGLRVVDASVIPVALASVSSAPSIMLAERAADIITAGAFLLAPVVDTQKKKKTFRGAGGGAAGAGAGAGGAAVASPASPGQHQTEPTTGSAAEEREVGISDGVGVIVVKKHQGEEEDKVVEESVQISDQEDDSPATLPIEQN